VTWLRKGLGFESGKVVAAAKSSVRVS